VFQPRKFVSPEVVFGVDALELAGQCCTNLGGRHALLVTDPGVLAAGWAGRVIASLERAGISHSLFSDVTPNPRAEEVMRGAEAFRSAGCDSIVAVGGGSPLDCAKGIGIVAANHGRILDFTGIDRVKLPLPPLLCVPTTGGTSADVSQFTIIADIARRTKATIVSKTTVPDVALVDPRTLTTMDPYLTACTGIDALVHAIEAFVSRGHSPLTDLHALEAIRLVCAWLPACIRDPHDLTARSWVMLASLDAGLAFSNASLGAVHAMAHSLGGALDLPHGECNALLLAHVLAFNLEAAEERFDHIGEAMGLELRGLSVVVKRARLLGAVTALLAEVGVRATLGERGVRSNDVPELAANALADVCIVTNPRRANQRDIETVYEEAL
jgi:alcohol dehydrogenase class IV